MQDSRDRFEGRIHVLVGRAMITQRDPHGALSVPVCASEPRGPLCPDGLYDGIGAPVVISVLSQKPDEALVHFCGREHFGSRKRAESGDQPVG